MKPMCPLVRRGVRLSGLCADCGGTPSGQIALGPGEVLFHQGDPADRIFALTEGWLRVLVTTPDGRSCAARLVGAGHVLGLEAFGAGGPQYTASADALRPARVCVVPLPQARLWFQGHPDEALALVATSVQDLAELERRLVNNASLSAEDRVYELVHDLVGQVPRATWVQLPATREQLGEVLGLTFETVSRMLHRLAALGVIEIDGRRVRLMGAHAAVASRRGDK